MPSLLSHDGWIFTLLFFTFLWIKRKLRLIKSHLMPLHSIEMHIHVLVYVIITQLLQSKSQAFKHDVISKKIVKNVPQSG